MAVYVSTAKTRNFVDFWAYIPSLLSLGLLFSSIYGLAISETLIDRRVELTAEEAIAVGEIEVNPSKIGALRVDLKSTFNGSSAPNDWIVYEIQLIDAQGKIVASAIDEDWKESGIWREGGESGTWQESDLRGGIDLRSPQAENLNVVIQLLERMESPQQDNPVFFEVKVQNKVIDRRALAWGFVCSGILAVCAVSATAASGQKVVEKRIEDSDPQGRVELGGKDNLIRIEVKTKLDETTPRTANFRLVINNPYGEKIYDRHHHVPLTLVEANGNKSGSGKLKLFLVLEPYGSYGFKVNVEPDNPVDWTYLEIRQGCRTLQETEVTTITS